MRSSKGGVQTTPPGVLAAARGASRNALEVLYTYACYAGDDAEWRGVASQLLAQHDALPA